MNIVGGKITCQDKASFTELISNHIDLQVPARDDGQVVSLPAIIRTCSVLVNTNLV